MNMLLIAALAAAIGTNEVTRADACATNAVELQKAEKPKGNLDIEHLLREQGLNFGVDDYGDFELSFEMPHGRRQMVHIFSKLCDYNGYKTIDIHSIAYRGKLTKPMLADLLNSDYQVGYWRVVRNDADQKDYAVFAVKVAWDIMPGDFEKCLRAVAEAADSKEDDWSDVDEQ